VCHNRRGRGCSCLPLVCRLQTIDLCTATADCTYFTVSFDLHPTNPTTGISNMTAGAADMVGTRRAPDEGPSPPTSSSNSDINSSSDSNSTTGCYGVVLWFRH